MQDRVMSCFHLAGHQQLQQWGCMIEEAWTAANAACNRQNDPTLMLGGKVWAKGIVHRQHMFSRMGVQGRGVCEVNLSRLRTGFP